MSIRCYVSLLDVFKLVALSDNTSKTGKYIYNHSNEKNQQTPKEARSDKCSFLLDKCLELNEFIV